MNNDVKEARTKMKIEKEFSKDEVWHNKKTGKDEPIPLMDTKKMAYKVRFLESKIEDHERQFKQLMRMRKIFLNEFIKRGKKLKTQKEMKEYRNIIFLTGKQLKPVLTKLDTLKVNNIDIKEAVKLGLIIEFPDTRRSDNL